jgi:hypothetical protein
MGGLKKISVLIVSVGSFSMTAKGAVIAMAVPDSGFETLFKPGSTSVTATLTAPAYTNGLGSGVSVTTVVPVLYSDLSTGLTTGNTVDVPSWVGTGAVQTGSAETGSLSYAANGGAYGSASGESITSAVLGSVVGGQGYVLTVDVAADNGTPAAPLLLTLLANGVPVTPTSTSFPTLTRAYQTVSETYSAAALAGDVGQALQIKLGTGSPATGQQLDFDNVTLSTTTVPEPVGLAGLVAGGCLLARRRGRSA